MDAIELKKILEAHREWVVAGCSGAGCANLSRADLSRADLSRADLSRADLYEADLSRADLSRADLSGADLYEANLSRADLSRADLSGANLSRADLSGANLYEAKNFNPDEYRRVFWIIPEVGAFTAWKKLAEGIVAKIEIPAKAKRTASLQGRKCRAEYVKVLALYDSVGKTVTGPGIGMHDGTKYPVGKIVRADSFDDSVFVECSHGIHFFLCRSEAQNYG